MNYKQRLWIGWLVGSAVFLSLTAWWAHTGWLVLGELVLAIWWMRACPKPSV